MNVLLLLGVLLGVFQLGLPDAVYDHPSRSASSFGRGPPPHSQNIRNYDRLSPQYQHPPQEYRSQHGDAFHPNPFNRGHVESHPDRFQGLVRENSAGYSAAEGSLPLRDAVEHIPIEGEMNINVRRSGGDASDDVAFSRGAVEAFPAPFLPYRDHETNAIVYSVQDDSDSLFGFRGDVEAPPSTSSNANPFLYFRGPQNFVSQENQWAPVPSLYSSWNNQVYFREAGFREKVVCYFESWASKRPSPVAFDTDDIDPFACTHLIYSFAGLDNETLTIVPLDHERDIIQGAYKSTIALRMRNPKLKIMIAVGGWAEGGTKYSKMVSSKESRDAFIESVIKFMEEHTFDGLDFDWEYPGATDRGGISTDKENMALLAEELQAKFQPRNWILSMAVPISKARIDEGYDIPRLTKAFDFLNLMAYDLRGAWDGYADHHAPLGPRSTDKYIHKGLNLKEGVQLFVDYGAPKNKLVIGLPFYGRSYTLQNPENTSPGSRAAGMGEEGKYTKEKGYISYFEICMHQRNGGWKIMRDEEGGPYMFKGDQWIGYDDEKYVEKKVNFIKNEGFGGVMFWAMDLDDYLGMCGTRWILLKTVRKVLHAPKTSEYSETITQSSSVINIAVKRPTTRATTEADTGYVPAVDETVAEEPPAHSAGDSCVVGDMVAKPGDCNGYLVCNQGAFIDLMCAAGLHWNNEKQICDWPENANCDASKQRPVPSVPGVSNPMPYPSAVVTQHPIVSLEGAPVPGPLSGDYKVVCYFTNWAWYRPGIGKYSPADIDENACTHIVYGFAVLDYSNLVIKPHDSWADIDNKFYEQVTALRTKGKKVLIAIGGWNDSEGDKYSRLVNSPSARAKFITHVISFIQTHNFDGLDLDWEYPVCWQVDCSRGPPTDKQGFADFVSELSMQFKPKGLLLSAAVSPSKKVIDTGYDVPVINKYLDWIAVMAYDFHGHWDKKTGHVAPLYPHPEDDYDYFNMDYAIRYWIEKGSDRRKIVLGMPLYGQAFTLNNPSVNGLNAPASLKGTAGTYTKAAGFLAYYEICKHVQEGWTVVKDPEGRMGPYAYHGNQWVSYDDVDTIRRKSEYIRQMGLGGGMVWALDLDDFRNHCGQGHHPLMKTIQSVLGPDMSAGIPHVDKPTYPVSELPHLPVISPAVGTSIDTGMGGGTKIAEKPSSYKVVCYFTNWSWYRQGEGKYMPENIDQSLCTHINYGFVVLDGNTLLIKPHDRWADIDNHFYEHVTAYKHKGIKVLVALGGWNDSKGDKYSRLVNDPVARARFNQHALEFVLQYGFDGLDLDWEYPTCWQVDCTAGPESDKKAFSAWIQELSAIFAPKGLLLTAAVSPSHKVIDLAYEVPVLSRHLDFINVMTYDYFGHWDKKIGHVSPMYNHTKLSNDKFYTDFSINYWLELGADPLKLIMGLPMYGQSFSLASSRNHGLNQASYGGGEAGPYTRARGFLSYYEICYFIKHNSWTVVRDPTGAMGPYAYKGSQWVGFDDIPQIRHKSQYVKEKGLGGAMIWALDLDDFRNRCGCEAYPLLKTINRVLRNYPSAAQPCPILGGGTVPNTKVMSTTPATTAYSTYPTQQTTTRQTTARQTTARQTTARQTTTRQYTQRPPDSNIASSSGMTGAACKNGEFRSHKECGKFYECYKEKLREVSCFAGLNWDGKRRCDLPSRVNCSPGSRISAGNPPTITDGQKPEVHPITPAWHPGVLKVNNEEFGSEGQPCTGGFKRHPQHCERFFECIHGKMSERRCFPGLHWNGKNRCLWINEVDCKLSPGFQETPPVVTASATQPKTKITKSYHRITTTQPRTTQSYQQITTTQPSTTTTTQAPSTQKRSTQWYVPWTPSTQSTTPRPTHAPGSLDTDGYKVVCYFTNWAWYRRGMAKFKPEDIDPDLCTHIIYGFAVLNGNTFVIKPHDTWADYDNKFYEKVTGLKARGVRVLIAIGGWNDSKGSKYSTLVNDPAKRAAFTSHVVEFIEKYNFDGLDLDWEYPVCWQVDCSKGPASDKDGFTAWMRELKAAFKPRNWLLTAAISPSEKVIKHAYHVPDLTRYLDFVNVMAYDYHGHWDKKTGHVAPMFHHPESSAPEFNANYTINFLINNGADRKKLIMGMPLYGQAFTLKDPSNTGLNSLASKGQAGQFTRAAGFLAYYEICDYVQNKGFTVVKDPSGSIGPYAHKGNQWVGFDDASMIKFKSEYIKKMGLGGGMVWALDLDDFNNRCGCEPHPLLRTIARTLGNYPAATKDCSIG